MNISGTKRNGKFSNSENLDIVAKRFLTKYAWLHKTVVYMTVFCTKPVFQVLWIQGSVVVFSALLSSDNKVK